MKINVLPKTLLGKCATGLGIAFIILIWLKVEYSIHIMTFAIAALGLAGFICTILAVFKSKDRTLGVFLAILVGLVIIAWIAAEIAYPH